MNIVKVACALVNNALQLKQNDFLLTNDNCNRLHTNSELLSLTDKDALDAFDKQVEVARIIDENQDFKELR